MKAYRKPLAMILCAFALVAVSIFGTMAYLTDTDAVTNTFTVGHVDIKLDEADVDKNGVIETGADNKPLPRVEANEYHLLPGHTYVKDPTVTVRKGSEDAFIRLLVTVTNIDGLTKAIPQASYGDYYTTINDKTVFLLQKLCEGWDPTQWACVGYTQKNAGDLGVYEFRYVGEKTWIGATEDKKLDPLFDTITLPDFFNNDEMDLIDGVKVEVVAHAIQADGFVDADGNPDVDAAWEAFGKQADALTEYETTAAESESKAEENSSDAEQGQ